MTGLFAKSHEYPERVSFGYDWAGSSSADASDTNPDRIVYACCYSVACSCRPKGLLLVGPVDWRDPNSVIGSQWYPKYQAKVKGTIGSVAQQKGITVIEMVAVYGPAP